MASLQTVKACRRDSLQQALKITTSYFKMSQKALKDNVTRERTA